MLVISIAVLGFGFGLTLLLVRLSGVVKDIRSIIERIDTILVTIENFIFKPFKGISKVLKVINKFISKD